MDQWAVELEKQMMGEDTGQDLTTVNVLMQRQQVKKCNSSISLN